MAAMNGAVIGGKSIVVRLHEPKQFRQEKLNARFNGANGGPGHALPRSVSGATSPTHSEGGESAYAGWGSSPRHAPSPLASPADKPARRASGSYYHAALTGTLGAPLAADDLAALSPIVRREILTGELARRVRTLGSVPPADVDGVVAQLVGLALADVVQGLQDPARLAAQVARVQADADEPDLDGATLADATPARTASPAASLAPPASERERMAAAVARLAPGAQEAALTELLMSLPKRERALCLFNNEQLRQKIADARAVLDADEDDDEPAPAPPAKPAAAAKPAAEPVASVSPVAPPEPAGEEGAYTLTTLAQLPAAEIVRIARAGAASGVPLPKEDAAVVTATDAFVDGLREKPVQQQKQALGDKLCVRRVSCVWRVCADAVRRFKVVKAFGIKGAPKLTIALLDSEELRALAHLMNSYPSVLKAKALALQAPK
jgi:polyadenylate-binding protein